MTHVLAHLRATELSARSPWHITCRAISSIRTGAPRNADLVVNSGSRSAHKGDSVNLVGVKSGYTAGEGAVGVGPQEAAAAVDNLSEFSPVLGCGRSVPTWFLGLSKYSSLRTATSGCYLSSA